MRSQVESASNLLTEFDSFRFLRRTVINQACHQNTSSGANQQGRALMTQGGVSRVHGWVVSGSVEDERHGQGPRKRSGCAAFRCNGTCCKELRCSRTCCGVIWLFRHKTAAVCVLCRSVPAGAASGLRTFTVSALTRCASPAAVRERALFAKPTDSTRGGWPAHAGGARPRRSNIRVRCGTLCAIAFFPARTKHTAQPTAVCAPRRAKQARHTSVAVAGR